MKKVITVILSFVFVITQVKAVAGSGEEYQDDFEKGITQVEVSGEALITLYGRSICNGKTCPTVEYAGATDFEDALSKTVVCTNGEKYINYQEGSSGKDKFDATTSQNGFSGTMYWSEEYYVTCTSTDTGADTIIETVKPNNNSGTTTTTTTKPVTNNGTNNGGTNNEYNSSTTVDPSETGVTTYFIVLGLVAIISYVGMLFIKKYNLFKNV